MTTEPYGKKNPFPAPVLSVKHLTGEGSPKETIHIEYSLDGSGMNYIAGDALAVIPANDPALADALIDKLGLSPDSQVPTPEGETASLKDALVHCYDITNVNKALLTKWAAASGSQDNRRSTLFGMLPPPFSLLLGQIRLFNASMARK
mgnify:CR=1 FL=1